MRHRRTADGYFVLPRRLAVRRVDQKLHLAILDEVEHVRTPLAQLVNQLSRHAPLLEHRQRPLRGTNGKARLNKLPGDRHSLIFVGVFHADENCS